MNVQDAAGVYDKRTRIWHGSDNHAMATHTHNHLRALELEPQYPHFRVAHFPLKKSVVCCTSVRMLQCPQASLSILVLRQENIEMPDAQARAATAGTSEDNKPSLNHAGTPR